MVKISYLLLSVLSATIVNAQETETIVDDEITVENTANAQETETIVDDVVTVENTTNALATETIVDDEVTVEDTKDEEIIIGEDNPADEADPWAYEESYETSMMVEPVQAKLWSQIDFWMGVTWGLYVPFSSYARDDDCYSKFV